MEFLILYVVLSVAVAIYADVKGGVNGVWAFLVCLVLTPVVCLLIAFLLHAGKFYKDKEQAAKAKAGPSGLRKCPACAEWVKTEAVRCRYCREDLPPVPVEMSPEERMGM